MCCYVFLSDESLCSRDAIKLNNLNNSIRSEEVGHAHVHTAYFKNISGQPNTNISTGRVECGRLNIWIVLHVSFKVVLISLSFGFKIINCTYC